VKRSYLKLACLLLLVFLLSVPFVLARGVGSGCGRCEEEVTQRMGDFTETTDERGEEYVFRTPNGDDTTETAQSGIVETLISSTEDADEDADGTDDVAPIVKMEFNYDEEIYLDTFMADIDLVNNKAVAYIDNTVSGRTGVDTDLTLYVPLKKGLTEKDLGNVEVYTCASGTTTVDDTSEVYPGCGGQSGVTETKVTPDSFEMHHGRYYALVTVSGTGGYSQVVIPGGGTGPSTVGAGETLDLEDEETIAYATKQNIANLIFVGDTSYSFLIGNVDLNNEYVVLHLEDSGRTLSLVPGEKESLDLNNDGINDVEIQVQSIDYPTVVIKLVKLTALGASPVIPLLVGETSVRESYSQSGEGGVWSNLFRFDRDSRSRLLTLALFALVVVFVLFLAGGRLIGKVWKSV